MVLRLTEERVTASDPGDVMVKYVYRHSPW
jgi:hypothetical protein